MTTPHLDAEALSGAVDGMATADEVAHLASCAECRVDLDALTAVARAVAAPVAPRTPADIDAAIARALTATVATSVSSGSAETASPDGTAGGSLEGVTGGSSVSSPGGAGSPAGVSGGSPSIVGIGAGRRRRSQRWVRTACGIAAAAVIVGAVAGIAHMGSARRSETATVARPAAASTTVTPSAAVAGPSFGDQSDPTAVAKLVEKALAGDASGAGGAGSTTPKANASSALASGSPASAGSTASSGPPASAGSTASSGPQASAGSTASSGPQAFSGPSPGCEEPARVALGLANNAAAVASFIATLRWRGQDAVVVAFSRPGGVSGAVMKAADCSLLALLPL